MSPRLCQRDPDIIEPVQVEHVLNYFEAILQHMSSAGEADTLGSVIRQSSLSASKELASRPKPLLTIDECVHVLFERQAIERPQAIALESWDATLTYHELAAAANMLTRTPAVTSCPTGPAPAVAIRPPSVAPVSPPRLNAP